MLRAALVSLPLAALITVGTSPALAHRGSRAHVAHEHHADEPAYTLPPRAPGVRARRWNSIVVHHSGTAGGSARAFETFHRGVRHMSRGMAYHFVIGNGRGLGDGAIEAGSRWTQQQPGAHVASALRDALSGAPVDEVAVGICLVGNNELAAPTPRQQRSLRALVSALRRAHNISATRVMGHNEVAGTHTACPGRHTDLRALRDSAG